MLLYKVGVCFCSSREWFSAHATLESRCLLLLLLRVGVCASFAIVGVCSSSSRVGVCASFSRVGVCFCSSREWLSAHVSLESGCLLLLL